MKHCFFTLFIIFFGCQSNHQNELLIIDVFKKYPEKKIILQQVAEIEYVPLETTRDVLLAGGQRVFYVSEQYILAANRLQGDVFVFNRNGKKIFNFNHKGRSSMEYAAITDIVFDEKKGEIYVFDNFSTSRILIYSITGEYIRTIKYPSNLRLKAYNFDDETMLVYDENGLLNNKYSEKPYMLLSKKEGYIDAVLNITMPVRYSSRTIIDVVDVNGNKLSQMFNINTPNNRYGAQNFVIGDISSDTIYWLTKNRKMIPFITRIPSVHDTDPIIVFTPELTTDKFVLLNVTTLNLKAVADKKESIRSSTLMYEFQTGRVDDVSFVNEDFPSMEYKMIVTDVDVPKNMTIISVDAFVLVEALEEKKLKGKLAQLAATLDEEDNPVLMIVHFK